ncbi:hypothetical protein SELMODRAFT_441994 [Selaginella moellendorffii]|uniref:Telomere-associated protein Rif1 N-terminal domain-containing protein n=1 Tax=Selaginella moellendorffii TaxID=88036 RepID=D8RPJ7_SELML|nr:uncharacterized protein LOC9637494 [Selaginella moellendorffii]EFJ26053.1 hypothetical protein SELMODRAFT_441994 [Selaginella moellendorffii]|eukprot:XP_002972832.1 uncharacterized protein LOC9637494 [Selaginella moellendorffii]
MALVIGAAAWCARTLLVLVPLEIPILGGNADVSGGNMSICVPENRREWIRQGESLVRSSIGRALCQVLDLVIDIPVTSRKYEFARSLADRILADNSRYGGPVLKEINIRALEGGFSRTVFLLTKCLARLHRQQQVEAWAWPWRMLKDLPFSLIFHCLPPLLTSLKDGFGTALHNPLMQMIVPAGLSSACDGGSSSSSEIVAEKLANELLWMAQRLKQNSALEVAILHWSSATQLAQWSLTSSSRVQKLLVKLSAFLCAGLVSLDVELQPEVTLRLLLLWLPLLCRTSHAIDETTLSSSDKIDTEQILSKVIQRLPDSYQELVLAMWLTEYVGSSSDWPNIQGCYHGWCQSTRKLYY